MGLCLTLSRGAFTEANFRECETQCAVARLQRGKNKCQKKKHIVGYRIAQHVSIWLFHPEKGTILRGTKKNN